MLFPELNRREIDSMKASESFFMGIPRRILNKRNQKVFVIGYHKTGTSSMGKALQILGYKVCGSIKRAKGYMEAESPYAFILDKARPLLNEYDAFQDTPWFLFYKELYAMYPDAYFILTTRDADKWIKSVQKHFGTKKYMYLDLIYGSYDSFGMENEYKEVYNKHNEECLAFFKDKPRFMVIDLSDFGWNKLCSFLGVKSPNVAFPHVNKSTDRGSLLSGLKRVMKKLYYK